MAFEGPVSSIKKGSCVEDHTRVLTLPMLFSRMVTSTQVCNPERLSPEL